MNRGFCITELLVVLTILAVLVVIAAPSFLESQERKQVAQAYSDLRTNAIALEAYAADSGGRFPPRGLYDRNETQITKLTGYIQVLDPIWMTTPVAYLSDERSLLDPYQSRHYDPNRVKSAAGASEWIRGRYNYTASRQSPENSESTELILLQRYGEWRLIGAGPDTYVFNTSFAPSSPSTAAVIPYDPTNGVMSVGDIGRSQREVEISLGAALGIQ